MVRTLATGASILLLAGMLIAGPASGAPDTARLLEWDDLMPKDWNPFAQLDAMRDSAGKIEDGTAEADRLMRAFVTAGKSAPVVPDLDGQRVRLPGFVVPLDHDGTKVSSFLLVPYFGACIHVPPPPANQIVYVQTADGYPMKELFDPVWVTGTITTQAHSNDVGDAGYTLQAETVEAYE
jgi:hypothetical protein